LLTASSRVRRIQLPLSNFIKKSLIIHHQSPSRRPRVIPLKKAILNITPTNGKDLFREVLILAKLTITSTLCSSKKEEMSMELDQTAKALLRGLDTSRKN
jgi:hypothetical protein